jgi:hypothetical protein
MARFEFVSNLAQMFDHTYSILIASSALGGEDAWRNEQDHAASLNVGRVAEGGNIDILVAQGALKFAQGSRTRVRSSDILRSGSGARQQTSCGAACPGRGWTIQPTADGSKRQPLPSWTREGPLT